MMFSILKQFECINARNHVLKNSSFIIVSFFLLRATTIILNPQTTRENSAFFIDSTSSHLFGNHFQ